MKNIISKILLLFVFFISQKAIAQNAVLPGDADETAEKAAMKLRLNEQRIQQIQLDKQKSAAIKTNNAPVANKNVRISGSGSGMQSATKTTEQRKADPTHNQKPLGGLNIDRPTAPAGTILDRPSAETPAGKN